MPLPPVHVPTVEQVVVVDGLADDAAWDEAPVLTDFVVFHEVPDTEPTGQTEVRVLYGADALYVHFRCHDPSPEETRANLGRRDTPVGDDSVLVYLDTTGEGQRAYVFEVNPKGVQSDGILLPGGGQDSSWDGQWRSAAVQTATGYEVELAIPWRSVRHPVQADVLGLSVERVIARFNQKSAWPRRDPDIDGILVQQARLVGPGELGRTAGLDVRPDLTYGVSQDGPSTQRWGMAGASAGITLRYAPVPQFWLLATANPDFSQVESDQSQIDVNQRYALSVQEKRPFFLEGQEWFGGPNGDLAYTRSMVSPVYGARATAELGGGTFAVLHTLDRTPSPSVSAGGGWTEEEMGDAPALQTLARGRRPLGDDGYVGLFYSDRRLPDVDLLNQVLGADARVRLSDAWLASGGLAGSSTRFADGSLGVGPAMNAEVTRTASQSTFSTAVRYLHEDFRAENGFVTQPDRIAVEERLEFRFFPAAPKITRVRVRPLNASAAMDTSGQLVEAFAGTSSYVNGKRGRYGGGGFEVGSEQYEGVWLPSVNGAFSVGGRIFPWVRGYLLSSEGTISVYDPEDPRLGWSAYNKVQLTFEPVPRVAWFVSTAHVKAWELDGEELYAGVIGRSRLEFFATRVWSTRWIVDYSAFSEVLRNEGLVAWERTPGRAVYLGGAYLGSPQTEFADPEWQVFAKASWVLSI
ncbi:MAG: carbohydrate binding family 9 domain-containing protein [Proteobacteria bacterium]|nr:carbohydrate binding family 9 domain-containing protein [Pseudomonadota bacterium]MCP4916172.1 carbohydrate binding family 9 domain-containing protein [Pseudomonadota bacterium]